jgi:hypothetical protein
MKYINLIFVILILLLTTCGDDDNETRPYPRVRTGDVSDITSEGALFRGEITVSSVEIIDYGFVWSTNSNPTLSNAEKISLGKKNGPGKFTQVVERSLEQSASYYVKAYARSDNYIVYGEVVKFVSLGSKGPKVLSVSPAKASWNDTVTVVGENFSEFLKNNTVNFDSVTAKIIRNTLDSLICIVPPLLAKDVSNVSVSVVGNIGILENAFRLKPPIIDAINPESGLVNSSVIISGHFFSTIHTKVFFDDIAATVVEVLSDKIICKVPAGLPEGLVALKVTTGSGDLKAETSFTSKKPKITEISPLQATYNDLITIKGESFPIDPGFVKIKFGNTYVNIISYTATELKFQVPADLKTPSHQIIFEYGAEKIIYDKVFTLLPPEIMDVSPVKTFFYNTITIKGKNFSPYINTVVVGDQSMEVVPISTEEMEIFLPYTISAHKNILKVISSGQTAIASQTLISRWIQIGSFIGTSDYVITPLNLGADMFLFTVNPSNNTSSLFKYSEETQSWTKSTTTPFSADCAQSCFSFSIGEKAYFGSGLKGYTDGVPMYTRDLWEYSASTNEWSEKGPVPKEILFASGFSSDGKGYYLAGTTVEGEFNYEVWEYSPQNDTWLQKTDYPEFYYGAIMVRTANNHFYILNGNNALMSYDLALNTWAQVTTFDDQFLFVIGDKLYFKGWENQLKIYDMQSQTWSEDLEFSADLQFNMSFSSNNKGYLFNNYSWNNSYLVWEFDPSY